MTEKALYFITGASASGKTVLLKEVIKSRSDLKTWFFDSIGVPGLEEMKACFGGPEKWQVHAAREWIRKLGESEDEGFVILEGQVRPSVVLEAAQAEGFTELHITLITCSHVERKRRLHEERAQPELDHLDMYAWAAYLQGQADALKLEVIDTTGLSIKEAAVLLSESINRFYNDEMICCNFS